MRDFTELEVWQKGKALANNIYALTKNFPPEERFGMTSQMRRAAVSVPSNIAEGMGRETPKEVLRFLFIARGSLYELETQIYIALDQGFLSEKVKEPLLDLSGQCKKLLNGFIRHYKSKA